MAGVSGKLINFHIYILSSFEVFQKDNPYPGGKNKSYSASSDYSSLFSKPDLSPTYVKNLDSKK